MKVKLFTKQDCPNCPKAKKICEELEKDGMIIEHNDVETSEGLAEALMHNVMSTPTIIIMKKNKEIIGWRGTTPTTKEVQKWLG